MSRLARRLLLALLLLTLAVPGRAQETPGPTTLIADLVRIEGDDRLIAEGNVVVLGQGRRLRARRLVYDRNRDRLMLEGPIRLEQPDGTEVLAEAADIDPDFESGLLAGARVILEDRLQIAGSEMVRSQGRFTDIRRAVGSSCEVCVPGRPPLWEVRAARVIHDEATAQIYFYNARFRIAGVPVFYLPVLRVPDGTRERVRGILTPSVRTGTDLGTRVLVPYFLPLGDHADLTLTPYLSTETRAIEARYRQAFVRGDVSLQGALARDDLAPGMTRAYVFADGRLRLPRGFDLQARLQTTNDDAFLRDYGFSDADRLTSSLGISRYRGAERIEAEVLRFQSLRADFDDTGEPQWIGDARWDRRHSVGGLGGWLDTTLIGHFHQRPSDADIDGRDMAQLRGVAAWREDWTGPAGLRLGAEGDLTLDLKRIADDSRFPELQTAATPEAALSLSWPLARREAGGARQVLEPVAQVAWTLPDTLDSPNDDSTAVAFDEGNLFARNRFPGLDRFEEGARANLALRWRRQAPGGLSLGATAGRVLRFTETDQFAPGTGLNGERSNWLAALDADLGERVSVRSLTLLDEQFGATLSETRLGLRAGRFALSSSYIWQREDTANALTDDVSEVAASARYGIGRNWSGNATLRHDFTVGRTNERRLALAFENECIRVDLSVAQRFRATRDVDLTTTYGFEVTLVGFGSDASPVRRGSCANGG